MLGPKGFFREVFMRFFSSFFSQVKGCIGVFLLIIPSLFLYLVLFAWLFVSIFPPFRAVRFVVVQKLYNLWIGISKFLFDLFSGVEFEIVGDLDKDTSYVIVSNHVSWGDAFLYYLQ